MDEEQTQEPQIAEEKSGNVYLEALQTLISDPAKKQEIIDRSRSFLDTVMPQASPTRSPEEPPSGPAANPYGSLASPMEKLIYGALSPKPRLEGFKALFNSIEDPDGVGLQKDPGSVVATLRDTSEPRPDPGKPGVPFGPVCTADGTFVTGDVTFEGNTPSLKAVDNAARTAFGSAASFDPRRGPDMDRIEETMKTIGEKPSVSVQAIQNDPRCAP